MCGISRMRALFRLLVALLATVVSSCGPADASNNRCIHSAARDPFDWANTDANLNEKNLYEKKHSICTQVCNKPAVTDWFYDLYLRMASGPYRSHWSASARDYLDQVNKASRRPELFASFSLAKGLNMRMRDLVVRGQNFVGDSVVATELDDHANCTGNTLGAPRDPGSDTCPEDAVVEEVFDPGTGPPSLFSPAPGVYYEWEQFTAWENSETSTPQDPNSVFRLLRIPFLTREPFDSDVDGYLGAKVTDSIATSRWQSMRSVVRTQNVLTPPTGPEYGKPERFAYHLKDVRIFGCACEFLIRTRVMNRLIIHLRPRWTRAQKANLDDEFNAFNSAQIFGQENNAENYWLPLEAYDACETRGGTLIVTMDDIPLFLDPIVDYFASDGTSRSSPARVFGATIECEAPERVRGSESWVGSKLQHRESDLCLEKNMKDVCNGHGTCNYQRVIEQPREVALVATTGSTNRMDNDGSFTHLHNVKDLRDDNWTPKLSNAPINCKPDRIGDLEWQFLTHFWTSTPSKRTVGDNRFHDQHKSDILYPRTQLCECDAGFFGKWCQWDAATFKDPDPLPIDDALVDQPCGHGRIHSSLSRFDSVDAWENTVADYKSNFQFIPCSAGDPGWFGPFASRTCTCAQTDPLCAASVLPHSPTCEGRGVCTFDDPTVFCECNASLGYYGRNTLCRDVCIPTFGYRAGQIGHAACTNGASCLKETGLPARCNCSSEWTGSGCDVPVTIQTDCRSPSDPFSKYNIKFDCTLQSRIDDAVADEAADLSANPDFQLLYTCTTANNNIRDPYLPAFIRHAVGDLVVRDVDLRDTTTARLQLIGAQHASPDEQRCRRIHEAMAESGQGPEVCRFPFQFNSTMPGNTGSICAYAFNAQQDRIALQLYGDRLIPCFRTDSPSQTWQCYVDDAQFDPAYLFVQCHFSISPVSAPLTEDRLHYILERRLCKTPRAAEPAPVVTCLASSPYLCVLQ